MYAQAQRAQARVPARRAIMREQGRPGLRRKRPLKYMGIFLRSFPFTEMRTLPQENLS